MKKILLVEDNKGITEGLCDIFTEPEYKLYTAKNIKEAGELLSQGSPGLVLLDVGLPDGDGFEFYKKHLAKHGLAVIFLTAKDEENDIVKGLELGAEDYITLSFKELLKAKNINYDIEKKEVKKDGEAVSLSSLELRILDLLFCNHNKAVSRDAVIDCIWEATGNDVYDHTVTVYMKRIRQKIGDDVIKTVKGIGYRIDTEDN